MNNQQLTIQEIDSKIAKFTEGLSKPFVPDDEKDLYRDAISKLQAQKRTLSSRINSHQATGQPDQENTPDGGKKKMLALWSNGLFLKMINWLIRLAPKSNKKDLSKKLKDLK